MHELTVIDNILRISAQVAGENKLKRIDIVHLNIGTMQHLNEEIMRHGFDAAKEGPLWATAKLEVRRLPVILKCNGCSEEFSPGDGKFYCPYCGDNNTRIIQGMELQIKSIEGE